MRPEWFSLGPKAKLSSEDQYPLVPFSKMWETDEVWIPLLAEHRQFAGRADFKQNDGVFSPHQWWYGLLEEEPST